MLREPALHGRGFVRAQIVEDQMDLEIRRHLHARGIRTIEADGYVASAVRSGLRQADGIHMTAEGHRRVAEQLAASIR